MSKNNKKKYPFQVCALKRKTRTLGVDAQLYTPRPEEDIPPLEMHSGYSRFVITLINTETDTVTTANISAKEVPSITLRTELAIKRVDRLNDYLYISNANSSQPASPAYTQKLFDKNFKGRTPAEVLMSNPDDREKLLNVREWLNKNLAAYPKNKSQIDAIDEAITLLDIGELKKNDDTPKVSIKPFEVFTSDCKFKTKTNDKGYNLIYGISLTCDPNKNNPFELKIMNCYAPVKTLPGGQKNIVMNEAVDKTEVSINMSIDEWNFVITEINNRKKDFEFMHSKAAFEEANRIYTDARNEAKNKTK